MDIRDLIPWRREDRPAAPGRPQHPLAALHREMDRLFEDFFRGDTPWPLSHLRGTGGAFSPSVDVRETDAELVVSAELPGIDEKDLEIDLGDDGLTIRGEKKEEHEERKEGLYRAERSYGSFQRFVPLPTAIVADKATAEFKNGVLTITLPKPPDAQPKRRKIEIKRG